MDQFRSSLESIDLASKQIVHSLQSSLKSFGKSPPPGADPQLPSGWSLGDRPAAHYVLRSAGCRLLAIYLLQTSAKKALLLDADLVVLAYWRADEVVLQFANLPIVEVALLAGEHILRRLPQ